MTYEFLYDGEGEFESGSGGGGDCRGDVDEE